MTVQGMKSLLITLFNAWSSAVSAAVMTMRTL
jgi:hypothetical protein